MRKLILFGASCLALAFSAAGMNITIYFAYNLRYYQIIQSSEDIIAQASQNIRTIINENPELQNLINEDTITNLDDIEKSLHKLRDPQKEINYKICILLATLFIISTSISLFLVIMMLCRITSN